MKISPGKIKSVQSKNVQSIIQADKIEHLTQHFHSSSPFGHQTPSETIQHMSNIAKINNDIIIFICYAKEDVNIAERLYNDLKNNDIMPWMAKKDIQIGDDWELKIRKAIQNCTYFLALLSENAVTRKGYTQKELKLALEIFDELPLSDRFILPVRLDECEPLHERLQKRHWVNLFPSYEDGLKKILHGVKPNDHISNNFGMQFQYISPGSFMMGNPEEEPDRCDDEILHQVTLTRGFYLQIMQVTQNQWEAVMKGGKNPSCFTDRNDCGDCPVEQVSWEDTQIFLKKLNKYEGRNLYRLPTEAEWEYACRAGKNTRYCFGDDARFLSEYAWYGEGQDGRTHPAGLKKTNSWNLYDMHGNIWEWCQDWYGKYPSENVMDPIGTSPDSQFSKVVRGGSVFYDASKCRSADRGILKPDERRRDVGFRVVKVS